MSLTIGSLFSGIGGLELGLERAGLGPVLWHVEIDPFCRRVLEKHWPRVTRYEDVREVGSCNLAPVDVVCGGFPCQDVSDSQGVGLAGARSGLWREMLRLVRELRPRFVVVENVAALATRGLDVVLGGLAACGYDAIWLPLRAADVGLPHGRRRLFLVAHADRDGRVAEPSARLHVRGARGDDADRRGPRVPGPRDGSEAWRAFRESGGPEPGVCRGPNGFPAGLELRRLSALGNAVVPQCAEVVGHMIQEMRSHER